MAPFQDSVRNNRQPPQKKGDGPFDFIIISGLSGAGRTTVLRAFEDNGFVTIDNLPLTFLENLSDLYKMPVAVSIDTRTQDLSSDHFASILKSVKKKRPKATFIFLECAESVLLTRYKQTRRPHPLTGKEISVALKEELDRLSPLQALADEVFDTSHCSTEQTSLWVSEQFCKKQPRLLVQLLSFSYRHGVPDEADIVFDARFLKNPFYENDLKSLTGKDQPVKEYLESDHLWGDYFQACLRLLHQSLLGFKKRGRAYVTIAAGCTGGQHRSVFMIETLAQNLQSNDLVLKVKHRELD